MLVEIEAVLAVVEAMLRTWLPAMAGLNLAVAGGAMWVARGELRTATADQADGLTLDECGEKYGRAAARGLAAIALVALALVGYILAFTIASADTTMLWLLMGLMIAVIITSQLTRKFGDWWGERVTREAHRVAGLPGA